MEAAADDTVAADDSSASAERPDRWEEWQVQVGDQFYELQRYPSSSSVWVKEGENFKPPPVTPGPSGPNAVKSWEVINADLSRPGHFVEQTKLFFGTSDSFTYCYIGDLFTNYFDCSRATNKDTHNPLCLRFKLKPDDCAWPVKLVHSDGTPVTCGFEKSASVSSVESALSTHIQFAEKHPPKGQLHPETAIFEWKKEEYAWNWISDDEYRMVQQRPVRPPGAKLWFDLEEGAATFDKFFLSLDKNSPEDIGRWLVALERLGNRNVILRRRAVDRMEDLSELYRQYPYSWCSRGEKCKGCNFAHKTEDLVQFPMLDRMVQQPVDRNSEVKWTEETQDLVDMVGRVVRFSPPSRGIELPRELMKATRNCCSHSRFSGAYLGWCWDLFESWALVLCGTRSLEALVKTLDDFISRERL